MCIRDSFQHRESCNNYYEAVPAIVEEYMNEISKITGRKYGLFDYYGAEDACLLYTSDHIDESCVCQILDVIHYCGAGGLYVVCQLADIRRFRPVHGQQI